MNETSASTYDPQKRRDLLEKASIGHAQILIILAEFLESRGFELTEDPNSYDLACIDGNTAWIFEAKTCTDSNAKDQIRKAISQLYEYQWRGRLIWPESIRLIIALDKPPLGLLEDWMIEFLYEDRGIELIWPEEGVFKILNWEARAAEDFDL